MPLKVKISQKIFPSQEFHWQRNSVYSYSVHEKLYVNSSRHSFCSLMYHYSPMRENTDQKNSKYGFFLRSDWFTEKTSILPEFFWGFIYTKFDDKWRKDLIFNFSKTKLQKRSYFHDQNKLKFMWLNVASCSYF